MGVGPAILIHGPTASGKTDLAIQVARRLGGEIVNADAMQVYADLRVLTARPSDEEMARAPHHLFGHVDAGRRYSTGSWLKDATAQINALREAGKIPVVVGGTGLYLQALTEGLSDIPEIPEAARTEARRLVAKDEAAAHARLGAVDPDAARRIAAGDRQRIARALEVYLHTGKPITSFHGAGEAVLKPGEWLGVALTPSRDLLYSRINSRVDRMMDNGLMDEARALWARRLDPELPAMRAHGVPGFCEYLDGKASLADAIERCKRDTRRYAKRQLTWIGHQFTRWIRIPTEHLDVRGRVVVALWHEVQG